MTPARRPALAVLVSAVVLAVTGVVAPAASAHTESDVVAVPALGEATVTLKPTHGCDGSPTVEVAIQVPVAGASAVEVEGWTATATDDGAGNTVVEWTGGSLPDAETGAFPVTFTAPDAVGELLLFPSVQVCEDGEELAWISGDPAGEYPAPRLLVLPAGSEPAATLDDVPSDAPGRAQLEAVVEVTPEDSTTTTAAPTSTVVSPSTTAAPSAGDAQSTDDPDDDDAADDGSGGLVVVLGVVALIGVVALAVITVRRRRGGGGDPTL